MLDIVCVPHLCSTKRAIKALQLIIQRNREEALHGEFGLTLGYTLSVLAISFKFHIICLRLALHLFTPSRHTFKYILCLSIGLIFFSDGFRLCILITVRFNKLFSDCLCNFKS